MKRRIHPTLHLTLAIVLGAGIGTPLFADSKDKKKDPEQIGNRDVGKGARLPLDCRSLVLCDAPEYHVADRQSLPLRKMRPQLPDPVGQFPAVSADRAAISRYLHPPSSE